MEGVCGAVSNHYVKNVMATLAELYEFLEKKQDNEHIDRVFTYDEFTIDELPKARLEILTWWKIEKLVEDEHFTIDKDFSIAYFNERANATNNQLLKYRYNYFAYLLSAKDNRIAKEAIDALIKVIHSLLPEDKEDYPHNAEDAIEILMSLSKRIKYRIDEAKALIWAVLESDYGYRTKLFCIRAAKEHDFFSSGDAEKIVCLCKDLLSLAKDGWREACCDLGLFYSSKLQGRSQPYLSFFYEALGDMEMSQLVDLATEPNNIAIPLMNEAHLEKAMGFYQKAGLTQKRNEAERCFRENKKKVVIPHFKTEKKTDQRIVDYYRDLAKEMIEGNLSWLLINLSYADRFLLPSYEQINKLMPQRKSMTDELGFVNRVMDINGNSRIAGESFNLYQMYEIWLMNIMNNYVINVILNAVKTKRLTYNKLKKWFLKSTPMLIASATR